MGDRIRVLVTFSTKKPFKMPKEIFLTSPSIIGFKVAKFGHFQDFLMKIQHELSILMLLIKVTSSLPPQREKIISFIFHRPDQVNHCTFRLVSKMMQTFDAQVPD